MSKVSLEQWRMFIAVVDSGGFAQAGLQLHKTQSTVSHGVKKLEQTLQKSLFSIVGRKAILTEFGESLLMSARTLVSQAEALEQDAISQNNQISNSLSIAVDTLYPKHKLMKAVSWFNNRFPSWNIQIYETVLSRCGELLEDGNIDIGISSIATKGFLAERVTTVELHPVISSQHKLATQHKIDFTDLEQHRQVVIRDGGLRNNVNTGWLGSQSRLTVSTLHEAYLMVQNNLGFAWLPKWFITECQFTSPSSVQIVNTGTQAKRSVSLNVLYNPELQQQVWFDELISKLKD